MQLRREMTHGRGSPVAFPRNCISGSEAEVGDDDAGGIADQLIAEDAERVQRVVRKIDAWLRDTLGDRSVASQTAYVCEHVGALASTDFDPDQEADRKRACTLLLALQRRLFGRKVT